MPADWEVVRVERVSDTRVRLWFVIRGNPSVPVTIDGELDTPDYRAKIAETLLFERYRVKGPAGSVPYTPDATPPSLGG